MAGPLDTGQLILTYLLFLPKIFFYLTTTLPSVTSELVHQRQLWHHVRLRVHNFPIKHRKKKIIVRPPPNFTCACYKQATRTHRSITAAISPYWVGCHVGQALRRILQSLGRLMAPSQITMAFAASFDTPSSSAAAVRFDTDSFTISIDTHCSVTMGKYPDQFDDLVLSKSPNVVQGIEGGLAIEGTGIFKFNIEDDDGRTHLI
jgi:hypothetical protein